MLTLFYANGAKQVIKLHPTFFKPDPKDKSGVEKKCKDIMLDLGAIKYKLERIK